ncbi:BEN domain-containing protein 5, partial [Cyphomyrmex costatus]
IHLGEGVWIDKNQYDLCVYYGKNGYQAFVKHLAVAIFGIEVLKTSSVTGGVCKRNPNKLPFQRLDPIKLTAINSMYI